MARGYLIIIIIIKEIQQRQCIVIEDLKVITQYTALNN